MPNRDGLDNRKMLTFHILPTHNIDYITALVGRCSPVSNIDIGITDTKEEIA